MNAILSLIRLALFFRTGDFQQLECNLSIRRSEGREATYRNSFKWTLPRISPGSNGRFVQSGQMVGLSCDNGFVKNDFNDESYNFECDRGKFNRTYIYEDLLCRNQRYRNVQVRSINPSQFRSKLFKCSEPEYRLYEVKLRQSDGSMKVLYSSCVDKKLMKSKFGHQPRRTDKPLLRHRQEDAIWGFDGFGENADERFYLSKGYVKKVQGKHLGGFYPGKYGKKRNYPYYFNRGHLAPMGDFNGDEERRASCEYINAAPQWDAFNSGSWSLVEREARKMLRKNTNDWEIYTGTYGIIQTPRGSLFAASILDENKRVKKQLLPVPMLYWKIVHNLKDERLSRAFVGVNNPEYKSPEEIPPRYKICNPIRPNGGGPYYKGNEFKGFTYECNLKDLLAALKTVEKIVI